MNTTSAISNTVMRRVRIIHSVRPLLSGTAIGSFFFLLALYGIGREVWVAHVVQNLQQAGMAATLNFLVAAFLNTRFIVQVLTIVAGAAFVYTLSDFLRTIRQTPRFS